MSAITRQWLTRSWHERIRKPGRPRLRAAPQKVGPLGIGEALVTVGDGLVGRRLRAIVEEIGVPAVCAVRASAAKLERDGLIDECEVLGGERSSAR